MTAQARPELASQVPSKYSLPLCRIDIILCLDLLYSNLHAFFPEADILLLHLLRRFFSDIRRNCVCGIANESGNG